MTAQFLGYFFVLALAVAAVTVWIEIVRRSRTRRG
jgi:hypothetical protein